MSSIPLTEAQKQLLAHGPNFAISPKRPSIGEYITAVEQTCKRISQWEAEEVWTEVKAVIKKMQPHGPNISREEQKALNELTEDNTRLVLTADKGLCLVVMDREGYIKKAEELLNQGTYKIIPTDPTTKQKNKLILLLKNINAEGGISEAHRCQHPKILWVAKDP